MNNKIMDTQTNKMGMNAAGGLAYNMEAEHALAQLCCTGTFNNTYYSSGQDQLAKVTELANQVSPEFLAKLAVYSRESAFMKDSSAVLLGVLASKDVNLFKQVFNRVVDNGKMLKNFCQVIRSGTTGRKSFGSALKKEIEKWLSARTDKQLFEDSVGNDPSLADVIKMVHPKPVSKEREAFYSYLLGKMEMGSAEKVSLLPKNVQEFEAFKKVNLSDCSERTVPNVPFQMLTALNLRDSEWVSIARNAKWHMTRMNLNTFARHGVFAVEGMTSLIAERLKDRDAIKHSKVFPYQLYAAFKNAEANIPSEVSLSLQDAMEVAIENVPAMEDVVVAVDCSGSMSCPVTGNRTGSVNTTISCNEVASLIAAAILRNGKNVTVMKFDTSAQEIRLNPRDSVMTNIQKIGFHGGGTDCSAPIRVANQNKVKAKVFVMISDNESWASQVRGSYRGTGMMQEWHSFKKRNPEAKLVCIDLAANTTMQVPSSPDVLNVGGWSDSAFDVMAGFVQNTGSADYWTKKIKAEVAI